MPSHALKRLDVEGLQFLYRCITLERLVTRRSDLIEFTDENTLTLTARLDLAVKDIPPDERLDVADALSSTDGRPASSQDVVLELADPDGKPAQPTRIRIQIVDDGLEDRPTSQADVTADEGDVPGLLALPLTSVARSSTTSFEARDGAGCLLPLLTKVEERELVYRGLSAMLLQKIHGFSPTSLQIVRKLVVETTPTSTDVDAALVALPEAAQLHAARRLDRVVAFCALRYFVTVYVPIGSTRHVVTLAWSSSVKPPLAGALPPKGLLRTLWRWVVRLGRWLSRMWCVIGSAEVAVDASTAGQCGSYHAQIVAPQDLFFDEAALEYQLNDVLVDGKESDGLRAPDQGAVTTLAHVHVTKPGSIRKATIVAKLAHRPSGLPRTSVFSSALTTVLLVGWGLTLYRSTDFKVELDSQSAVLLLLLVPTAIGAFLVVPSPHSLTARVIFPTRLCLGLVSLTPLLAAVPLVLKWDGRISLGMVIASVLFSFVGFLVLIRQLNRLNTTAKNADARLS